MNDRDFILEILIAKCNLYFFKLVDDMKFEKLIVQRIIVSTLRQQNLALASQNEHFSW